MTKKVRTTLQVESGQVNKLQKIAKRLGYVQKRGAGTGKVGSISQLIQAIAKNEVKVEK